VIVGHQKQIQFLTATRTSGRMGHAFIFSGPGKTGKKTVALEWLAQILGTKLGEGSAHPDFLFVAPLVDPKTGKTAGEITVDQIRGLIRKLYLKPSIGKYKAALIDEAQAMNAEAQNALLKTLEEPPGDALIILITPDSRRLLATIRSRCQKLRFNFVAQKDLEILAKDLVSRNGNKLDEELMAEAVKISFGRPGRLAGFIADPERIKKWQASEKEFVRVIKSDLPEKFIYSAKIVESENISETLEIWQAYFRNLMLKTLQEAEIPESRPLESSQSSGLRGAGSKFVFSKVKENPLTPEKMSAILKKIHALTVILQTTNASPKLAIESFMMDI
jgi:DNA polymerase-3 subunit delta'